MIPANSFNLVESSEEYDKLLREQIGHNNCPKGFIIFAPSCRYCYKIITDKAEKYDLMEERDGHIYFHKECLEKYRETSCSCENSSRYYYHKSPDQKNYCINNMYCSLTTCPNNPPFSTKYNKYIEKDQEIIKQELQLFYSKGYSCGLCYKYGCTIDCIISHLNIHHDIFINDVTESPSWCQLCRNENNYEQPQVIKHKVCNKCTNFINNIHLNGQISMRSWRSYRFGDSLIRSIDNVETIGNLKQWAPPYLHLGPLFGFITDKKNYNDLIYNYLINSRLPKLISDDYTIISYRYAMECKNNSNYFLIDYSIKEMLKKIELLIKTYSTIINEVITINVITDLIVEYATVQLIPFYKTVAFIVKLIDQIV